MKKLRILYFNSAVAFICAFIITTFIHEGGHFIAYIIFDAQPTMYPNYVSIPDQSLADYIRIIAALAGPCISLLQGVIFWSVLRYKINNTVFSLLNLWLCLLGFINFFGYLMLTPFSTEGDTGRSAQLLQIPYFYRILIAVIGIITIILIVLKIGKWFARFIPDNTDISIRRRYVNALVFFPIITGSVINSALAFPLPSVLSLIYPATSAYVILSSYGVILKSGGGFTGTSMMEEKLSIPLISGLIILLITKSLLSLGLHFT